MNALADFADAFRDINRRVCIETYTSYYFTAKFGDHDAASDFVPRAMLAVLNRCHAARRAGRELPDAAKREVFEAFFRNEQEHVVGPSIEAANAAFEWPLMKFLALRPSIRFAYLPRRRPLFFRNFAETAERIEQGLRAFDLAAAAGWRHVEGTLRDYQVLPDAFFAGPAAYFRTVRQELAA